MVIFAQQHFKADHVSCGVKSGKAPNEQMFSGLPPKRISNLRVAYTPGDANPAARLSLDRLRAAPR
jgi:hypothetical protein